MIWNLWCPCCLSVSQAKNVGTEKKASSSKDKTAAKRCHGAKINTEKKRESLTHEEDVASVEWRRRRRQQWLPSSSYHQPPLPTSLTMITIFFACSVRAAYVLTKRPNDCSTQPQSAQHDIAWTRTVLQWWHEHRAHSCAISRLIFLMLEVISMFLQIAVFHSPPPTPPPTLGLRRVVSFRNVLNRNNAVPCWEKINVGDETMHTCSSFSRERNECDSFFLLCARFTFIL